MQIEKDIYKPSRVFYIISAALEYFISILTGTTYLAKLAGSIGISDSTVGVLSSFVALGCGFQIIALLFNSDKPVKSMVLIMNLINQLCFTLLYTVPLFSFSANTKTAIFICLLLAGNILLNISFSPKVTWSRTIIDDSKRGIFSAKCEITSLISGMVFTVIMGRLIDYFDALGKQKTAFIICAIALFVITVSHAICIILMKEKRHTEGREDQSVLKRLKIALTDKATLRLIPVFVLWYAALYTTTPFFGTYQLNELGFTMTAVAILSAAYAIVRSIVSAPLGILGDRKSFSTMFAFASSMMMIGLIINSLGGAVSHVIYYMLYAIAIAGTNNGQMNLILDYVDYDKRMGSIAILYTIGGFVGFFTSLAIKPLVDRIQANGNRFLFLEHVYAQQVLSVIGALLVFLTILYVIFVVNKMPRRKI